MKKLIFLLITIVVLSSCKKDNVNPEGKITVVYKYNSLKEYKNPPTLQIVDVPQGKQLDVYSVSFTEGVYYDSSTFIVPLGHEIQINMISPYDYSYLELNSQNLTIYYNGIAIQPIQQINNQATFTIN